MWLHVPSTFCPSAPVTPGWNSASSWLCQNLARSAMWRAKHQPPQSWSRVLKKESLTTRQFGKICEPSTADRGVARFIASLEDTPASPSPRSDACSATKTPDISGQTSNESSRRSSQQPASSRTSLTIYVWALNKSTMTFDKWVTALRRACSARKKSVLHTSENDSLFWATPTTADATKGRTVSCNGGLGGPDLTTMSADWSCARAKESLNRKTSNWPTPSPNDYKGSSQPGQRSGQLSEAAECLFPNLQTKDGLWTTPCADDTGSRVNKYAQGGQALSLQASHFSLPDPTNLTPGGNSLKNTQNSLPRPRLNPLFVEHLMGLPIGWTDSEDVGMRSYQQWQASHLSLLRKLCVDSRIYDA